MAFFFKKKFQSMSNEAIDDFKEMETKNDQLQDEDVHSEL